MPTTPTTPVSAPPRPGGVDGEQLEPLLRRGGFDGDAVDEAEGLAALVASGVRVDGAHGTRDRDGVGDAQGRPSGVYKRLAAAVTAIRSHPRDLVLGRTTRDDRGFVAEIAVAAADPAKGDRRVLAVGRLAFAVDARGRLDLGARGAGSRLVVAVTDGFGQGCAIFDLRDNADATAAGLVAEAKEALAVELLAFFLDEEGAADDDPDPDPDGGDRADTALAAA